MAKLSKIIRPLVLTLFCIQSLNGEDMTTTDTTTTEKEGTTTTITTTTTEAAEPVNGDDADVKSVIDFAFKSDANPKKSIEFIEGQKSGSNPVVYKLKVGITETFECTEENNPETNNLVVRKDNRCQSTTSCTAEVAKLSTPGHTYRMDGMQCVA